MLAGAQGEWDAGLQKGLRTSTQGASYQSVFEPHLQCGKARRGSVRGQTCRERLSAPCQMDGRGEAGGIWARPRRFAEVSGGDEEEREEEAGRVMKETGGRPVCALPSMNVVPSFTFITRRTSRTDPRT